MTGRSDRAGKQKIVFYGKRFTKKPGKEDCGCAKDPSGRPGTHAKSSKNRKVVVVGFGQ